ncbi:Ribonuclease H [bioreactor metagenome]|uniref:Ribonuclease H n=1 Tax=bioreactor metagenome TaxID=1076179 RepID=A0A644V2G6_9ZZZZ|nr:tRNA (N6-threonylcarbamoyladenosine(37)-N6)-methyltransferase TrmO [Methanocorpusculum sp.]
MDQLTIYTDGASRGNPGQAAAAWLILRGDDVLESDVLTLGRATNNAAEYSALNAALGRAARLCTPKETKVKVFSDSNLMISQMTGRYAVRSPDLLPLYEKAKSLASVFAGVAYTHVPRENPYVGSCDWLCNNALDLLSRPSRPVQKKIECVPIGIVHSPFAFPEDAPRQGVFTDKPSRITIYEQYREGLSGLAAGDRVFVLCWFDRAERDILKVKPHGQGDGGMRGVFSTRAPVRPNPISLTLVTITSINDLVLTVKGLEALDNTPVLDIKPYYGDIDS